MFYLGIQSFVENITNINYSTCLMIQPFSRYCPINFIIDILISIQVSCMTHSSLMVPCTFSILFPIDFPTMWSPSCKLVYKPHEPHKYYSSRLSIINLSCWRDKATSLSRGPHIVDFVEQIFLACPSGLITLGLQGHLGFFHPPERKVHGLPTGYPWVSMDIY